MRRREHEITDSNKINEVIGRCQFCRIGLCDNGVPYLVPVCFGYKPGVMYFHCAKEGRKLDILRKNNRVCFQMDCDTEILKGMNACDWGLRYMSIMGEGRAFLVSEKEEKMSALEIIMRKYSGSEQEFLFNEQSVTRTEIVRITIESVSGKHNGTD